MLLLPMIAATVLTVLSSSASIDFYVGTYTQPNESKGIYRATLDRKTGALTTPVLAVETPNPSYLAFHPNGKFLYSVDESGHGEVNAFAVAEDHALTHLNTQSAGGSAPCHLCLDAIGKNLFVANYTSGTLASFQVLRDGSLSAPITTIQHSGSGPNKDRQEGPHMHCVATSPDNKLVYACDLGTDELLMYKLNPLSGELTPNEPKSIHMARGNGPRHLAIHPNSKFLFVNGELDNTITSLSLDSKTGVPSPIESWSTLPEGKHLDRKYTAELEIHPSGKWVYVSNRGDDSVAVFAIARDGKLKLVEIEPTGVKEPRGLSIDPSGKWMVVAGQNSNDLTSLAIDAKTGRLSPSGHKVSVAMPVDVLFVKA